MHPSASFSPIRRRTVLKAGFATAAACATPRFARSAAPDFEILETRVISQQPDYYHGWPTVTRCASGELIVTWSGRRESHVCPFGSVEMMRSRDDGATWSYPRTLHDGPIDDRDSGVVETAKGTLLVTTFSSLAYQERLLDLGKKTDDPRWLAVQRRQPDDGARRAELGVWALRSTDGGRSWSSRIDTIVNSPHGPVQLADGRLLYAGKKLWSAPRSIGVAESHDDGQSWQWLAEIPARDGDDPSGAYHELHAVECASGKLIVQIRNHNPTNKGETLQSESSDGGRTWTAPHAIGVWGLPSHLLRLRDDRLLMSYGHRRDPFGNQARISDDEGGTWSEPMILSGDGIGSDLGYPSTVELDDGRMLTIWYEKLADSPRAVLRQAIWRLT